MPVPSGPAEDAGIDPVQQRTAENRRRLADLFDRLDEDQLDTPGLCHAWTVREVLAHLAMPFEVSLPSLLWRTVRNRGSIDRASEQIAADLARRPLPELTGLLRPPARLRPTARPARRRPARPLADGARLAAHHPGLPRSGTPGGRLVGLRLSTTDQAWEWGSGATVSGPSEALALAVSGRGAALGDLTGRGGDLLAARLDGG